MKINDNGIDREMTQEEEIAYKEDAKIALENQENWELDKKNRSNAILSKLGISLEEARELGL